MDLKAKKAKENRSSFIIHHLAAGYWLLAAGYWLEPPFAFCCSLFA